MFFYGESLNPVAVGYRNDFGRVSLTLWGMPVQYCIRLYGCSTGAG